MIGKVVCAILVLFLSLLTIVETQPSPTKIVETDPMAQGLVEDPENGCIYIIFRERISLYCRNVANVAPFQVVVHETALNGASIVDWVPQVDFFGHLIFFIRRATDAAPNLCRMVATSAAREPNEPAARFTFIGRSDHFTYCGDRSESVERTPIYVILLDSLREMYSMSNIASSPVGMTRWSIQGPRNFSASFPTGVPPSTNPSFAYATDILVYRNNHQIFKYHLSSGAVESVPPLPGAASTRGPWRASTSDAHVLQCDGVLVCRMSMLNSTNEFSKNKSFDNEISLVSWNGMSVLFTYPGAQIRAHTFGPPDFTLEIDPNEIPYGSITPETILMDENVDRPPVFLTPGNDINTIRGSWRARNTTVGLAPQIARVTRDNVWFLRLDPGFYHAIGQISRVPQPGSSVIMDIASPAACATQQPGKSLGLVARDLSRNRTALVVNHGSKTKIIIVDNANIETSRQETPLFTNSLSSAISFISSRLVAKINDTILLLEAYTAYYRDPLLVIARLNTATNDFYRQSLILGTSGCQHPIRVTNYAISPSGAYIIVSSQNTTGSSLLLRIVNVATGRISEPISIFGSPLFFTSLESSAMMIKSLRLPVIFSTDETEAVIFARNDQGPGCWAVTLSSGSVQQRGIFNSSTEYSFGIGKSSDGKRFVALANDSANQLSVVDLSIAYSVITLPFNFSGPTSSLRFITTVNGAIVGYSLGSVSTAFVVDPTTSSSQLVTILDSQMMFKVLDVIPAGVDQVIFLNATTDFTLDLVRCNTLNFSCETILIISCDSICDSSHFRAYSTDSIVIDLNDLESVQVVQISSRILRPTSNTPENLKKVEAIAPNVFLFVESQRYYLVEMASNGSLVSRGSTKFSPGLLDPYYQREEHHEYVKDANGGVRIVMTASEFDDWLSAVPQTVVFPGSVCLSSSQCPQEYACNSSFGTCQASFVELETCPLPRPLSAVCTIQGWVIQGNVTVPGGSTVVVPGGTVTVNGSLQLSSNSTLVFVASGTLNVTGCVRPDGALVAEVPGSQQSQSGVIELIAFGGGYCDGEKREFTNTTIRSSGPGDACASLRSSVAYGERSIGVLYSYDFASCAPQDASAAALSAGAIAGIVIAAIVILGIIVAFVVFVSVRRRVAPYSGHADTEPKHDHELEDG